MMRGLRQFLVAVVSALTRAGSELFRAIRKNLFDWTAKAFAAALAALVIYFWQPIQAAWVNPALNWMRSQVEDAENLAPEEALQVAKRYVGATAVAAIPFRNLGDPIQYIAAWAASDCDPTSPDLDDVTAIASHCPWGTGSLQAYLLIGDGVGFESIPTGVPAMPDHLHAEAAADPSVLAIFAGVTDWNGDGIHEILSIADQDAMTAPQRTYHVTLFDTASHEVDQLRMTDTSGGYRLVGVGPDDPKLRTWLSARMAEHDAALFDHYERGANCRRFATGSLVCEVPVAVDGANQSEGEDSGSASAKGSDAEAAFAALESDIIGDWTGANGSNFTFGEITLKYRPIGHDIDALLLGAADCRLVDGTVDLFNLFKGPLLLLDKKRGAASVLYLQDDRHHREIPSIIVGRQFYWLALAVDRQIVVIDRQTFEATGARVAQWMTARSVDFEYPEEVDYKDAQLDALGLAAAGLTYAGSPITVSVDGRDLGGEFDEAFGCTGPDLWEGVSPSDDVVEHFPAEPVEASASGPQAAAGFRPLPRPARGNAPTDGP